MSERETVLWLTGWSAPKRIWDPFAAHFPDVRHEAVDFLNVLRVEEIREKAIQIVENTNGPIRMVGWSMGAMLAMELAVLFPDRVKQLCLVGAAGSFVRRQKGDTGWDLRILRRMTIRLLEEPDAVLEEFDRRMFTAAEAEAGHLARWRDMVRVGPISAQALAEGLRFLEEFALKEPDCLTMPVDLLAGGQDVICPPEGARRLAASLPRACLTVWEEAGHCPLWTDSGRFLQWLKEAMDRGD